MKISLWAWILMLCHQLLYLSLLFHFALVLGICSFAGVLICFRLSQKEAGTGEGICKPAFTLLFEHSKEATPVFVGRVNACPMFSLLPFLVYWLALQREPRYIAYTLIKVLFYKGRLSNKYLL